MPEQLRMLDFAVHDGALNALFVEKTGQGPELADGDPGDGVAELLKGRGGRTTDGGRPERKPPLFGLAGKKKGKFPAARNQADGGRRGHGHRTMPRVQDWRKSIRHLISSRGGKSVDKAWMASFKVRFWRKMTLWAFLSASMVSLGNWLRSKPIWLSP